MLEDNKTRIQKDKKKVKGNTDEKKTKTPKGQEDVDTKTSKIQRKTKTQKKHPYLFCHLFVYLCSFL